MMFSIAGAASPRATVVQAAQPTPMVSVTTLPALPGSIPTAQPLGGSSPLPTPPPALTSPALPPPTRSPQDLAAHAIIEVGGDVVKPLVITLKDLEHMRGTSLTLQVIDPDGRKRVHAFRGVLLADVIAAAQPRFGDDAATLARKYVMVTSVDGSAAIVGFPEFAAQFNAKKILLAYLFDFKNLSSPGFAMLVVPEDATRARFLTVARLTVGEPQP
ncbi:MAG: hypothetical protein M3Z37_08550 [Candidatus Eremiobacteraeota bacterium]|nr:hypothetical protein [Candidatus Eremiobacteraeota bacterium]